VWEEAAALGREFGLVADLCILDLTTLTQACGSRTHGHPISAVSSNRRQSADL
jgi:hypothetical protein